MKNRLICLFACFVFLTISVGCHISSSSSSKLPDSANGAKNTAESSGLTDRKASTLTLEGYPHLYFYSGGKVTYTLSSDDTDNNIYLYNTNTNQTINIDMDTGFATSGDMVWMENGKAYMCPYYVDGFGRLTEIDLENGKANEIEKIPLDSQYVYFEKLSATEFLYNTSEGGDTLLSKHKGDDICSYSYYIFNTDAKKSTPFLTMQLNLNKQKGKASRYARKQGDRIYLLTDTANADYDDQAIEVYTRDGHLEEVRQLPAVINQKSQLITSFNMLGDYYFFQTSNHDTFFCRYDNGKFTELDIPTAYELHLPLVQAKKPDDSIRYAYLCEFAGEYSPTMLIFDMKTGEFYRYRFDIDNEYHNVKEILTDENNNLAAWCTKDDYNSNNDGKTSKVFFINQKTILDNMVLIKQENKLE